jgi:hypothetical protein
MSQKITTLSFISVLPYKSQILMAAQCEVPTFNASNIAIAQ